MRLAESLVARGLVRAALARDQLRDTLERLVGGLTGGWSTSLGYGLLLPDPRRTLDLDSARRDLGSARVEPRCQWRWVWVVFTVIAVVTTAWAAETWSSGTRCGGSTPRSPSPLAGSIRMPLP